MPENQESISQEAGERLAKVIARAGLCSRRDAEKWIADGRVKVDGRTIDSPAVNVTPAQAILVDGVPLSARHGTRLWLYHKPAGLVVTEKDPEGRPTIFEKLTAEGLPRVVTVGRLDINTEGLLLLTNDGGLKRVLELPRTGWLRKYRVRAFGSIDQARLDTLKLGMTVDGISYGPIEAMLERVQGGNVWLVVALREGKNREVKNVLGALGLVVNRLIRISYGPFQLGDMPAGGITLVKSRVLRDQLGEKLAREAGVDFDSAFPDETLARPEKPPERNPRDPNSRLRLKPVRAEKRPAVPRPKTGEPRFAKARAESRLPPRPAQGGRDGEEKPITRRVLFDDGRALIEAAPRRGRDHRDEAPPHAGGRERSSAPKGRGGGEDRPERGRPEHVRRASGDKKDFGSRPERGPRERPERGQRERPEVARSERSGAGRGARAESGPVSRTGSRPPSQASGKPAPNGGAPGKRSGPRSGQPPVSAGPGRPRPFGKPATGRSANGKPFTGKPTTGRSAAGRPASGRPFAGKPTARPPRKPTGPRRGTT